MIGGRGPVKRSTSTRHDCALGPCPSRDVPRSRFALSGCIAGWVAGGDADASPPLGDLIAAHREALGAAISASLSLPLLFQSFSMMCAARDNAFQDGHIGAIIRLVSRWTGCPSVAERRGR
ncbi:MAG: hypothetical protein H6893_13215 [Brucellaceae bacterium]|nr:hypothetical protein [Brucellaceae bacterium]